MRRVALEEIKTVMMEELTGPLGRLELLLEPFVEAYDVFVQTVKEIKEAWRTLVNGYFIRIITYYLAVKFVFAFNIRQFNVENRDRGEVATTYTNMVQGKRAVYLARLVLPRRLTEVTGEMYVDEVFTELKMGDVVCVI